MLKKLIVCAAYLLLMLANVNGQAKLRVNPDSLDFRTDLQSQSFRISNTGDMALTWTATWSQAWIDTVKPKTGLVGSGDTVLVEVTIDRNRLGPHQNTGSVQIESNGGDETVVLVATRPNQPPQVRMNIADTTLTVGIGKYIVNLDAVFMDPDGDPLTHPRPTSSVDTVLTSVSGNTMVVSVPADKVDPKVGVDVDSATISVKAEDGFGDSAVTGFRIAINDPPFADRPLPGLTVKLPGEKQTVKITIGLMISDKEVFKDPDFGDTLTFVASSGAVNIAETAFPEAGLLSITAKDTGQTQVTISASDERGGAITDSFQVTVTVNAPTIFADLEHTPAQPIAETEVVTVSAVLLDEEGVATAVLFGREGGESAFTRLAPMTLSSGNVWTGTIAREFVGNRGTEYFIRATDVDSFRTNSPRFSIRVMVPDPGIEASQAQPSLAYRLVSVPIDLLSPAPDAVLFDDFGGRYDDTRWRFFEPPPDADDLPSEYPNTGDMTPGKAFWLIARERVRIDTGPGTTNPIDKPYPIRLQSGWNYFGNPFNFPAFPRITLSNDSAFVFYFFDGEWSDAKEPQNNLLEPFEGYAVLSPNSGDTLFVDPDRSSSAASLAKNKMTLNSGQSQWSLRIVARCQEARDSNNLAATADDASPEWDRRDYPEPPIIGDYVSVYFPHPEWHKFSTKFTTDIRPASETGHTWEFEVETNILDKVALTFDGVADVPEEYEAWLVDEAVQVSTNLREHNHYSVAGIGVANPKSLKLVVGRSDFVAGRLEGTLSIPRTYELSQNFPNPFNPSTTIRYGLPQDDRVTVRIYDMLGEEVATLIHNEDRTAGFHAVVWNGRNQANRPVASGIYIYQIRTGKFSRAAKMVLVK